MWKVQGLYVVCFDDDVQVRMLKELERGFFVSADWKGVAGGQSFIS